jgi:ribonuclease HI
MNLVNLFTDGGCRGNPGSGAIGIVIFDSENNLLYEHSECIGNTTNNRAEYMALIKGLDLCAKFTRRKVCCYCDSELVVNQMSGVWKLKNDELRGLFHKVRTNVQVFAEVTFQHVNRTNQNIKKADRLLNNAFEGRCISQDHSNR